MVVFEYFLAQRGRQIIAVCKYKIFLTIRSLGRYSDKPAMDYRHVPTSRLNQLKFPKGNY